MDSKTRKILTKRWKGRSFKWSGKHWKVEQVKIYFNEKERNYE